LELQLLFWAFTYYPKGMQTTIYPEDEANYLIVQLEISKTVENFQNGGI
jgi:hypothetical protein